MGGDRQVHVSFNKADAESAGKSPTKLLAFEKFPFLYERPDGKLEVPEDFEVAIIGAGLAGVAAAVQLDHLGGEGFCHAALEGRRDEAVSPEEHVGHRTGRAEGIRFWQRIPEAQGDWL